MFSHVCSIDAVLVVQYDHALSFCCAILCICHLTALTALHISPLLVILLTLHNPAKFTSRYDRYS